MGRDEAWRTASERGKPDPERTRRPTSVVGSGLATPPRQAALPSWRPAGYRGGPSFAHPAEDDFARLLSFYGIRWVYEPTTFALAWGEDGQPAQSFTPDFYLPDHRLYIEMTTMRQRLVTRKNRKLRRLRTLYPNVRIKLLYRRDYLRLVDAYPSASRRLGPCRLGPVVLGASTIAERVRELARMLTADLATGCGSAPAAERPLVLGVGSAAGRFVADLGEELRRLGLVFEVDRVDVTRYRIIGGMRRVRVRRPPHSPVAGRRVLLVADIVNTGLSLGYLIGWLRRRGAIAVDVCALLDRQSARLVEVPIRYRGFEAPSDLLVGYGLPLRRQYRELPFIATVRGV